jgi:hypothetical protein
MSALDRPAREPHGRAAPQREGHAYSQQLGRHAWFVIHATARAVKSEEDLLDFIDFVQAFFDAYPCHRCRTNLQLHCQTLLDALPKLTLTPRKPANFSACVWAARLHACVTVHVRRSQERRKADSWVSDESFELATRIIQTAYDDDVYPLL